MAAVCKTSIPFGCDDCEESGTMKQVAVAFSNKVRLLVYPYLFNGCPFFYHYNHSSEFDLNLRCIFCKLFAQPFHPFLYLFTFWAQQLCAIFIVGTKGFDY